MAPEPGVLPASAPAAGPRRRPRPGPAGPHLLQVLRTVSLPTWGRQRARLAVAVLAIALGVALATAVQLINGSAVAEFSRATRIVNGEPDLLLRAATADFDERAHATLAEAPGLAEALPRLEAELLLRRGDGVAAGPAPGAGGPAGDPDPTPTFDPGTGLTRIPAGQALRLTVIGTDALRLPALAPDLLPRLPPAGPGAPDLGRFPLLDPGLLHLNAPALRALDLRPGDPVALRTPRGWLPLRVGGELPAPGAPLAVWDLAGAQQALDRLGRLSRIDLRLSPGTDPAAFQQALGPRLAAQGLVLHPPGDAAARLGQVSRAYRVNLTVLAWVALFTGAFLVHAVLSLTVVQRLPQIALLGALGLDRRSRRRWMLAETALIGLAGSALGLLLGLALAAAALHWMGGDLGGGYFDGLAPRLQLRPLDLLLPATLGLGAALLGGWLPARQAERMAPAQVLKGLGSQWAGSHAVPPQRRAALGLALLLAAGLLTQLPPVQGLPLAAYLAVALLLVGSIALMPALLRGLIGGVGRGAARAAAAPLAPPRHPVPPPRPALLRTLLHLARARHERLPEQVSVAVAGIVASLALAVALTVMVGSFRQAVMDWLDAVLPAPLYLRAAEGATLPPELLPAVAALPGLARVEALRSIPLLLDPARPAVALIARDLGPDPAATLPRVGPAWTGDSPLPDLWLSEAWAALHGGRPGATVRLSLPDATGRHRPVDFVVRGLWRDYARQHGSALMARSVWTALSGDGRVSDLALHPDPATAPATLAAALRDLAERQGAAVEIARADEIRALSLAVFDRSFAVTTWLQSVAIGIGLFGAAASLSAQTLIRQREFGLMAHLGFTRRQMLGLVVAESALGTAAAVLMGLLAGVAVAAVLVHVVHPQSFHWTLPLALPPGRLLLLGAAVVLAGMAAAALAGRRALATPAVRAVREEG